MKHIAAGIGLSLGVLFYGVSYSKTEPTPLSAPGTVEEVHSFVLPASSPATHFSAFTYESLGSVQKADSLISYAKKLLGRAYVYGDTGKKGFDCSGFTTHVFAKFGINVSRSSAQQAHDGEFVPRLKAQKGDLIVFTGTNPAIREPGHVGIIISEPGEPLAFVHSSSNGGVKISEVENTRYDTRFLEVRRVL
jgi:cell wall-associated NlpC family hydrolase